MRLVRTAPAAALLGSVLCIASCFGHHTADEEVLKRGAGADEDPSTTDDSVQEEEDDGDDRPATGGGGGQARDAGRATDAGRTADAGACAGITDPIEALLCGAGLGGTGIDGIIDGILGGGSIDEVIDGILGGGGNRDAGAPRRDAGTPRADAGTRDAGTARDAGAARDGGVGDAGVDRAAFVATIQRILEDLITAIFTGSFPTRDAGLSARVISADDKARNDDLTRTSEQCAEATRDDLLTRLICARQVLETLEAE